jgi:hypothetical protein
MAPEVMVVRDIGMAAMAVYVLSMMVEVGMNIGVGLMYIPNAIHPEVHLQLLFPTEAIFSRMQMLL